MNKTTQWKEWVFTWRWASKASLEPGILSRVEMNVSWRVPPTLMVIRLSRVRFTGITGSPGIATGPARKSLRFFFPSVFFFWWCRVMLTLGGLLVYPVIHSVNYIWRKLSQCAKKNGSANYSSQRRHSLRKVCAENVIEFNLVWNLHKQFAQNPIIKSASNDNIPCRLSWTPITKRKAMQKIYRRSRLQNSVDNAKHNVVFRCGINSSNICCVTFKSRKLQRISW